MSIKISPSILSADFSKLGEEIKSIEPYSDMLHIDVMDGHFVPNITIGPVIIESIKKVTYLPLDTHLMIQNPEKYVESFIESGSDIITVHIETVNKNSLDDIVNKIRNAHKKITIALNPNTKLETIMPHIDKVDMILLMTVNPGFAGQSFIESVLSKIVKLRKILQERELDVDIEVDGGINAETAPLVKYAGANVLVSASFIFRNKDRKEAIRELREE
jgi:ribulose-phosphate 3-epimerase